MKRRTIQTFIVLTACLAASTAFGQNAEQRVEQLNRQAMEAYTALDIERAGNLLQQALDITYQGGVSARLAARVNLNMGIVYIGGLGDNDSGLQFFIQGLCLDPAAELDPLTDPFDHGIDALSDELHLLEADFDVF